jgi:hypothetical protein
LDELIGKATSNTSTTSDFYLPDNVGFKLTMNIAKVALNKFSAASIVGVLNLKDKKLFTDNLSLETLKGDITFTGMLDASEKNINIKGSTKLIQIDINQLFYQFNNFGQTTLLDKNIKGTATATIDFSSNWNRQLVCDLNSLQAVSDLTIERGELIDFKTLESLSKYVELKELKHIKFNTFQSHIDIKNQALTFSNTEINNSVLNINFRGTHSFTNEIDYHIKLLLSEVLAKKPGKNKQLDDELAYVENDLENKRCVFLSMTGTVDNPIIKYDRKAMKQKIKEDIKLEKQTLKQILKEEFGIFKKDTTLNTTKQIKKANQKFIIDNGNKKEENKKEEDDDF